MKYCNKCKTTKPFSDFNKCAGRKDGCQTRCRDCDRLIAIQSYRKDPKKFAERTRAARIRNRQYVWDYLLLNPCIDCGVKDPRCLDFDHRDPDSKVECVSIGMNLGWSIKKLQDEIDKCDVRCANCHRVKTYEQMNYWTGEF